jgi:ABC-type branched-subunit amino acid transport system permease subunit
MWNLLAGYGGMVSVGQQAFIGCGGYALSRVDFSRKFSQLSQNPMITDQ